jgi:hypothetical protein
VNFQAHKGREPATKMRSQSSPTTIENRTVSEAFPAEQSRQ